MNFKRIAYAYAHPLKCAYVVTDHLRLWSGTFSTPIKD